MRPRTRALRRPLATMASLTVVVALLLTLAPVGAQAATGSETEAEQRFASLVNRERADRGLPALRIASDLTSVARSHTADMAAQRKLYHNPDLSTDVTNWRRLAENVGYSSNGVDSLHRALMNSKGHKANILDAQVTQLGVGVVVRDGLTWVTQVFRLPERENSRVESSSAPLTLEAFSDVLASSDHAGNIEALVGADVTQGCDTRRYCPSNGVSRAEMATFLARALGLRSSTDRPFSDVRGGTHAGNIAALEALGLTDGCGGGRFCPNATVTRAQMATFLADALDLRDGGDGAFRDVSSSSTHAGSIAALVAADITEGCQPGRFCPSGTVTRAAMASFLARGFGL